MFSSFRRCFLSATPYLRPSLSSAYASKQFRLSSTRRALSTDSSDSSAQSVPIAQDEDYRMNVLVVNKVRTKPVNDALAMLIGHLHREYPGIRTFHEDRENRPPWTEFWMPGPDSEKIGLVITLGGDGTILHASSLFSAGAVPPVLSFSMGTLGFLLPFHYDDFVEAFKSFFTGRATFLDRMRLACTFYDEKLVKKDQKDWQVMNEIALHRGSSPHLTTIDMFVDGQHLTESVSDGLIVSTPTGSTAYSLSAGGPIVHPSLSALVLTPICPRSLSFRPLVFPSSSVITLRVGEDSRAPACISMDGRTSHVLNPDESVVVQVSPFPVPCMNRSSIASMNNYGEIEHSEGDGPDKEDDWVRDINNLLRYNITFRSKALLRSPSGEANKS